MLQAYASEHVSYEVGMLLDAARLVLAVGDAETPERCAYLESFLLHVRNLDAFLASRRLGPADVCADDYLPGYRASFAHHSSKDIEARLAHLTSYRTTRRQWPTRELVGAALQGFDEFLAALGEDKNYAHRAAWFVRCQDKRQEFRTAASSPGRFGDSIARTRSS